MIKGYKYRIYPTPVQIKKIEQALGCCRLIYNLALQTKIDCYKANGTTLSAFDLMKQLVELKAEYGWLKEVNSQTLQTAIKNVEFSFQSFFRGNGFPRFKNKRGEQSFQNPGNTRRIDFEKGLLTIPKIKDIPIVVSRRFVGDIKDISISRTATGKYYASIFIDDGQEYPLKCSVDTNTAIGVDMGIAYYAVLSNGVKIDNPKYFKKGLSRLKCLQKRVSRKKRGSNNRRKAAKRLAIQYERIANMRKDFQHKLSDAITKQYDTICVEDLAVRNMIKNRKLAQAISDVGWGEFLRQLKYKCLWKGKNFLQVPRFFASTKICSNCGVVNKTLTLTDRIWTCASCGAEHDRDENAGRNVKEYFFRCSGEGISGEPVELLSLDRAVKQEMVLV